MSEKWRKRAANEVKRAKLLDAEEGKVALSTKKFTSQTVLLLLQHLSSQFKGYQDARDQLCRKEKPTRKRKRVKPVVISGSSEIQEAFRNKPKAFQKPVASMELTDSQVAQVQKHIDNLCSCLYALLEEEEDIGERLEHPEDHPEVCAMQEEFRRELKEEHELSGDDLDNAVTNELQHWLSDHEVRLDQIGNEKVRIYDLLEKFGVPAADVELHREKVQVETLGAERGNVVWSRCVEECFQQEELTKLDKMLNDGVKSEILPDYALDPDGINQNIYDRDGDGKVKGGGASGFMSRTGLAEAASIVQGGHGWPSTSDLDTGLSAFSVRYKMETPKQAQELFEALQKETTAEAARRIGRDCEEATTVEALDESTVRDKPPKHEKLLLAQKKKMVQSQQRAADDHESEYEDDVCFECDNGGDLVLCDSKGCPNAYHPECIYVPEGQPPLTMDTLPDGDWFCPACKATKFSLCQQADAVMEMDTC